MYTLALLGTALLLVGLLVAIRRRGAGGAGGAASDAVARALAETAATATAVPARPMPLSPPSDADVPAGWARPVPVPEAAATGDAAPPSPFDPPPAASWPEDEIVTAPGWPMPGELDLSWSGPATSPPEVRAAPAAAPARADAAGDGPAAGGEAPEDEALMPRWLPPADAGGPPEPAEIAPAEPELTAIAPVAAVSWAPPPAEAPADDPPAFEMPTWDGATDAPEPTAVPAGLPAGGGPADEAADIAWLETAASAAEPATDDSGLIAWLEPARAAVDPEPGCSGRFAVGGTAAAAGDQALVAVTFPVPLDAAPSAWRRGPGAGAAPGTLVLEVEGLDNCEESDLVVMEAPGFGPAADGVTLRVTALGPGPFAAAGTYRIA